MTSASNLFGTGRSIQNAKVQWLYMEALYTRNRFLSVPFCFILSTLHSCTISDVFSTEMRAYYILDQEIQWDQEVVIIIEVKNYFHITNLTKAKILYIVSEGTVGRKMINIGKQQLKLSFKGVIYTDHNEWMILEGEWCVGGWWYRDFVV